MIMRNKQYSNNDDDGNDGPAEKMSMLELAKYVEQETIEHISNLYENFKVGIITREEYYAGIKLLQFEEPESLADAGDVTGLHDAGSLCSERKKDENETEEIMLTEIPDLLTPQEAVEYLRIDTLSRKNPLDALTHLIDTGMLYPTLISSNRFYSIEELRKCVVRLTKKKRD